MKKIKYSLKAYLFIVVFFTIAHLYISLFVSNVCRINTGVAFGLFSGFDQVYLSISQVLLLSVTVFLLLKVFKTLFYYWELVFAFLITSLANILDRIFIGGVCDYISIFNLPVFNFNDIFILSSLFLFFLFIFYEEIYSSRTRRRN